VDASETLGTPGACNSAGCAAYEGDGIRMFKVPCFFFASKSPLLRKKNIIRPMALFLVISNSIPEERGLTM
jgi:hypothetical protein